MKTDIETYAQGKKWYLYGLVWLFNVYLFISVVQFNPDTPLPFFVSIAQSFDFFLHEMAHVITAFLPGILTAAAGSFSELFLGTMLIITAFKTRGYFASVLCSLWFMLACQSVGTYMADARAQKLELSSLGGALSGSDTVIHDWHYIFGQLNILSADTFIGGFVRVIGVLVGLCGLAFGLWLIYKMATRQPQTS